MLPLILNAGSVRVENILAIFSQKWTILGTSACENLQIQEPAIKLFFPATKSLRGSVKTMSFIFNLLAAASVSL